MIRTLPCLWIVVTLFAVGGAQDTHAPQAAIPNVIEAGARVELVRGGYRALEGPVAIPDGGLYFSDIEANRTYQLHPNGTISVQREDTKGTNGLFLLNDGRLLGAEGGGGRVVAVTPDGRVTALARAVHELLMITRLLSVFDLFDAEAEAVKSFGDTGPLHAPRPYEILSALASLFSPPIYSSSRG